MLNLHTDHEAQIPRYPILMLLFVAQFGCIPDLLGPPGNRLQRESADPLVFTLAIVTNVAIVCYISAFGVNYAVSRIWSCCRRCGKDCNALECYECTTSRAPSASAAATIEVASADTDRSHNTAISEIRHEEVPASRTSESDYVHTNRSSQAESPPSNTQEAFEGNTQTDEERRTSRDGIPDIPSTDKQTADDDGPLFSGSILDILWKVGTRLVIYIMLPIILTMVLISMATDDDDEKGDTESAEEGTADPTASRPPEDEPASQSRAYRLRMYIRHCLYRGLRLVLRFIGKVVWRIMMIWLTLWGYSFNWYMFKVTKQYPPKILAVAFGLFNFATAVASYIVFFDGEGTAAPKWANIFG
jgi:hypothetical protein